MTPEQQLLAEQFREFGYRAEELGGNVAGRFGFSNGHKRVAGAPTWDLAFERLQTYHLEHGGAAIQ